MGIKYSKEMIKMEMIFTITLLLMIIFFLMSIETLRHTLVKALLIFVVCIALIIVYKIRKTRAYIFLTEEGLLSSRLKVDVNYDVIDEIFTRELYARFETYKGIFMKYNGSEVIEIRPYCCYSDYSNMINFIVDRNENITVRDGVKYLVKDNKWYDKYVVKEMGGGITFTIVVLVNIVLGISIFLL